MGATQSMKQSSTKADARRRRRFVPSAAGLCLNPAEERGGLAGEHGTNDDMDLAGLDRPGLHRRAAAAYSLLGRRRD